MESKYIFLFSGILEISEKKWGTENSIKSLELGATLAMQMFFLVVILLYVVCTIIIKTSSMK